MSWNVESVQQYVLWRELETCSASQTGTLQVRTPSVTLHS